MNSREIDICFVTGYSEVECRMSVVTSVCCDNHLSIVDQILFHKLTEL